MYMYMYIRQRPFFKLKRSIKLAVSNNASLHTDDYEKNQCTYIYLNDRNLPDRNALVNPFSVLKWTLSTLILKLFRFLNTGN